MLLNSYLLLDILFLSVLFIYLHDGIYLFILINSLIKLIICFWNLNTR